MLSKVASAFVRLATVPDTPPYRREHLARDIIGKSGSLKERLAAIDAERARA